VDPDSLNPDPDTDPVRIWELNDQKLMKKNTAKIFFIFSDQNLQFLMYKLQEKPSALKKEHSALLKI
jgi:hypothetical protein